MHQLTRLDRIAGCLYGLAASAMVLTAVTGKRSEKASSDDLTGAILTAGRTCLALKARGRATRFQADALPDARLCEPYRSAIAAIALGLLCPPAEALADGRLLLREADTPASQSACLGFIAALTSHLRSGSEMAQALTATLGLVEHDEDAGDLLPPLMRLRQTSEKTPLEQLLSEPVANDELSSILAGAVSCALAHADQWEDTVALAACGASHALAVSSLTGAFLGTTLGVAAIPLEAIEHLHEGPLLYELACELNLASQA